MLPENEIEPSVVLTIAGFDPSGGAGIIADIRTFLHFGCAPAAAITSITFQNSEAVFGALHESADSLRAQILPIIEESRIGAVKVGMVPTAELAREIARLIRDGNLPAPVIDPVLRSSSGYQLIEEDAIDVLMSELMPLGSLVTPNIPEAERLTGLTITSEDDMRAAARKLRDLGAPAVLLKGGHLQQESEASSTEAIDILNHAGNETAFRGEWIDAPAVRGTGCMLSSGIAAGLGKGMTLEAAVGEAKRFVTSAISEVPDFGD